MADSNTLLLLHGDAIIDSSGKAHSITNNGVTVSTAQSKFGGKSLYFSGNACLSITSNLFSICNGDFTIDWWQYRQNTGTLGCFNVLNAAGFSQFLIQHGGGTKLYGSYTGSAWDVVSGASAFTLAQNTWVHCAIVKSGNTIATYQGGVKVWSGAVSNSFAAGTGQVLIGCHADPSNRDYFKGYIDEFRISNVARWTGNFTPPTAAYGPSLGEKYGASFIEATAYGVKQGKALVGGTAYSIKRGRTLVGGTGYVVSSEPETIPVTITGSGRASYSSAIINGKTYTAATSGIEVRPGDVITFEVWGSSTSAKGYVWVDGWEVYVTINGDKTYDWTVPEGCKSIKIALFYVSTSPKYGTVTVTTT